MAKNEDCRITDSALCKWIDKDCDACYIQNSEAQRRCTKSVGGFSCDNDSCAGRY